MPRQNQANALACIPPDNAFVLATQRENTENKQHAIDMASTMPTRNCPMQTLFHPFALGVTMSLPLSPVDSDTPVACHHNFLAAMSPVKFKKGTCRSFFKLPMSPIKFG